MSSRLLGVTGRIATIACLLVLAMTVAGSASPGGLVVSVTGEVVVHRSGAEEAASEGYVLLEGDTITVRPGAMCTGFTPDGESFDLKGPSELQLAVSEGGLVGEVKSWVQLQLAEWIGETKRQPLTTRNVRDWSVSTEAPAPLVPAPEGRVRHAESRFLWSDVPGVDRYVVTVAPAIGDEVTHMIHDNSMILSDLAPGEQYVWKISPEAEGWNGGARWRGFSVLTAEEERKLDEALADLDDLEAGVLLLSSGLHEEAIYRFDAAVSSAAHSRSARLWRAKALADIGLYEEACQDLMDARGQE